MNIKEMTSSLKMENLYFSNCSIERASHIENGEYSIDIQKDINKIENHTYDVELRVLIDKEQKDLKLSIVANARFVFESNNYEKEDTIINQNTIAIMFPFIRSQIALLTSQPNMPPIILPTVNTSKIR